MYPKTNPVLSGGHHSGGDVRGDTYPRGWSTHQGATSHQVSPRERPHCH
jgi:hypothetical protein